MRKRAGALIALPVLGALVGALARGAVGLAIEGSPGPLSSSATWYRAVSQWNLLQAAIIGALALLLFGGILFLWYERRVSFFRHSGEASHALSLPVLAVVPIFTTPAEQSAKRRRIAWRALALVVVVVSVGYLVWWTRVMP